MARRSPHALPRRPEAIPSGRAQKQTVARRNYAARLFGYDLFISFALGPPPRGTLSYASDLARRLRERDFTVFFSEDEVPPGEQLAPALEKALYRSHTLVVIAGRGTLEGPRWVRTEVERFRNRHATRAVIPISVGGALQDPALAEQTRQWLAFQDKIWLDESPEAVANGIASDPLIECLALAPARFRSNVIWRWTLGIVAAILVGLAAAATWFGIDAKNHSLDANARRLELTSRSQLGVDNDLALLLAVEGYRIRPLPEFAALLREGLSVRGQTIKTLRLDKDARVTYAAWSPNDSRIVTALADGAARVWDALTGKEMKRLKGHTGPLNSAAWDKDGERIVTTSQDGAAWIWATQSGAMQAVLVGHTGDVHSAAWNSTGTRIATVSDDKRARIWDPDPTTGEEPLRVIEGHGAEPRYVAWSPDDKFVATARVSTSRASYCSLLLALSRMAVSSQIASDEAYNGVDISRPIHYSFVST